MGVIIPQVITSDRASGAQVIDGSLKFNEDNKNYLKVTPGSNGNRRTWTWSGWVKRNTFGSSLMSRFFMGGTTSVSSGNAVIAFYQDRLFWQIHSSSERITTNRLFRDTGWYHIVVALDTTLASDFGTSERVKIYVNGKREHSFSTSGYPSQFMDSGVNSTQGMLLGAGRGSSGNEPDGPFDGQISNVYLIDGLQLGPGYFGFTDPLTGTWKPKKFRAKGTTVNDGRVFSSTGTFSNWDDDGNYPKTELFDGQTYAVGGSTPNGASSDSSSEATFDFGDQQITGFQNLQVNIFLSSNQASATNVVNVNGVDITQECHAAGNNQWTTVDLGSKFTSLKSFRIANNNIYVGGFIIDGVIMKDSTTTNLSFGTNGFYLPLDGNSSIGKDQSGNGNDLTPINFGGSVALDKSTGAKPILNTIGGATATVGVFGSRQNIGYAVTVSDASGSNKYYLDGVETPTLTGLIRGATYTFDQTDNSNNTHPLVFGTTANGNNYGIGVSITGSPGSTGITSITIPHNAPDTLYYHCSAHNNMGGSITGITTNEKLADPYASNCVLALPLVGVSSDVSASIACTSSTKAVTANGDAAASTTQSNFYGGSFEFDGTGDYITVTDSSEITLGAGDFTIEYWQNLDSVSGNPTPLDKGYSGSGIDANGWVIQYASSKNKFIIGGTDILVDTDNTPTGKWIHWAFVRSSGTLKMYRDGIEKVSASNSTDLSHATNLGIGANLEAGSGFNAAAGAIDGYLSDIRIYKGVAKYTSNFVPASTNPDILPDTPSGVSGGSKLTKITDGSVSFTGIGATHLPVADSADFTMGSGDWTMECFAFPQTPSSSQYQSLVQKYATTASNSSWFWSVYAYTTGYGTHNFWFYRPDGTQYSYTAATAPFALNQWHHFVATRDGDTIRLYIDGVQDGTIDVTGQSMNDTTCDLTIGADSANNYAMLGHISNARVVKGTCLYPDGKSFTPPTAPLTNVTNTKLLCCQSNTSSTQATVIPDFTNFPAPYSAAARFGSYKEYTTVNKDVTSATTLPMSNPSHYQGNALNLSSGGFQITTVNSAAEDFFMGMWVHFDTYANSKQFGVDIAGNYVYFETQSSGAVKIRHTGDGGSTSAATSLNDGNWHHIALSRTGDTLYGFVDGTAVVNDSGGLSGANSVAANSNFNFWGADNNFTSYNIDGQIIDAFIYIGKGVSSYTTPTAPLIGNDGTINHYSGFTDSDAYFISPCIDVTGSDANSITGFFENIAGANTGSATNFNPFITDIHAVRGQESGYCTWNPLAVQQSGHGGFRDGNLEIIASTDGSGKATLATFAIPSTGKWYWELKAYRTGAINNGGGAVGVAERSALAKAAASGTRLGEASSSSWTLGLNDFNARHANTVDYSGYLNGGSAVTDTGIIGIAVDMDNDKMWMHYNGVYGHAGGAGDPVGGANPMFSGEFSGLEIFPAGGIAVDSGSGYIRANWGQKPFKYAPPDGFQPLNNANIRPETVITRPDQYVGVTTYIGAGGTKKVDGLKFSPDMVWVKSRGSAYAPVLGDSVRGFSETTMLSPSVTAEEDRGTDPTDGSERGYISAKHDKGFTVVDGTGTSQVNGSSEDYVAWCLKAGGNENTFNVDGVGYATTTAAGLTAGSMNPTGASVGTKQGFSIIGYTGNGGSGTMPHGLNQAPNLIIAKNRDAQANWFVFSEELAYNEALQLNSTNGKYSAAPAGINGSTSTTFTLGGARGETNTSGEKYVAYCWHDVPGLQKFGKYRGNNSTDGVYVELGFRPAWLIIKRFTSDHSNGGWYIYDSTRDPYNPAFNFVVGESPYAERRASNNSTFINTYYIDFLSNGFKLYNNSTNENYTDIDYLYMAWAEAPSVDLYGGGANAR